MILNWLLKRLGVSTRKRPLGFSESTSGFKRKSPRITKVISSKSPYLGSAKLRIGGSKLCLGFQKSSRYCARSRSSEWIRRRRQKSNLSFRRTPHFKHSKSNFSLTCSTRLMRLPSGWKQCFTRPKNFKFLKKPTNMLKFRKDCADLMTATKAILK